MEEGEVKGTLGIPMTTALEGPTTFEEFGGWTTRLLGDKGAVSAFGIGVPTGGGGTPPTKAPEVGVEITSPELAITILTRTPIRGIRGNFNSK